MKQRKEPGQTVCSKSFREATIMNCYPSKNDNDIAVETSYNDLLPRGEEIRLVSRYLRGTVQKCSSSQSFHETTYFRFDPIHNGKAFPHVLKTKNEMICGIYQNAVEQIQQERESHDAEPT